MDTIVAIDIAELEPSTRREFLATMALKEISEGMKWQQTTRQYLTAAGETCSPLTKMDEVASPLDDLSVVGASFVIFALYS